MKRIHIHLTRLQIDRLQKLSDRLGGLPVAEIIRRAVDKLLDDEDKK